MTDTDLTQPVTAAGAALLAAEAIRALNHLTITRGGYVFPSDVDSTLRSLSQMVERLPQALHQAGAWLRAEANARRVTRDDLPGGPEYTEDPGQGAILVSMVELGLQRAQDEAQTLATLLASIAGDTSHLCGVEQEPRRVVRAVEYSPAQEG